MHVEPRIYATYLRQRNIFTNTELSKFINYAENVETLLIIKVANCCEPERFR
jgi:hypothetical protein